MNRPLGTLLGILIPLIGTSTGAALVFFLKKEIRPWIQELLLGFAAGVMIAASVWSLLLPAIEMAGPGAAWLPAVSGFLLGVGFLAAVQAAAGRLERAGARANRSGTALLAAAVTLHNLPEGMAVGVAFAGLLSGQGLVHFSDATALAVGIAIQNIPEGAIISLPLAAAGKSRKKSFFYGVLSGVIEPVGAGLTLLLRFVTPVLPYILSFAAGAMLYVVIEELIPSLRSGSGQERAFHPGTMGAAAGFALMMLLDVALG